MKTILILSFLCIFLKLSESITVMSIDLGSEWMKIAIVKPGVPMEIVLNKETKRKTEVAVAMKDGERLFGSSAGAQGIRFPKTTYFYLLDLLAKKMDNPLVQRYKERFPYYDLVEDPVTGYVQFRHDAEKNIIYSPEELLAMTLNYSKSLAEDHAQQPVDFCVITVPSYFNQAERMMLLYAAKLGGLPETQLMDDNTASALNYGVFRRNDINATATYIMFYDMGATSITASVVAYQVVKVNGVADPQLSVKGVGFDRTLGGLDMELRLREHLIKLFNENKKTKMDVRTSPRSMAKLLKEARRLKRVLSANNEHHARVESLIDDEDFHAKVSREDFEGLCDDLWPRVAEPMKNALASSSLTMDLISKVILVGGGTRVPKVQEILLKESGIGALGKSLNTDEAPALGASYEAASRSNAFRVKTFHIKSAAVYPIDIEFDRVTAHENGSETVKHVRKTLFQRNNPYPQRKVITFNRFYNDFGFDINYGDLKFLTEEQMKVFGLRTISNVKLQGVDIAHEKYGTSNETESKGVKAHFRMDENGLLNLEEIESLYESTPNTTETESTNTTEEVDPSTFQKLKEGLSSLFGGGDGDKESENKEADAKAGEKPKEDDKKSTSEEEKKTTPEDDKKSTSEKDKKTEKEQEEAKEKVEKEEVKDKNAKEGDTTGEKDKPKEKATDDKTTEKNKTESAEPKKPKKIKISSPLNKTINRLDYVVQSEESYNASKDKLRLLAEKDAWKVAKEEAMNSLESYIYDKRDKLYQDNYEKAMTPTETEEITKALNDASDWMFDLEDDAEPEVYKEKLKDLRKLCRPWLLRVKERTDLVPLLKDMETIFNYTSHFVAAIDALPEDDQIYTDVEIKLIKKTFNDTVTWKNETLKMQEALEPSKDNVMKPDDVKVKMGELNREVQYLLNKARTAKPKKKKEEAKSNSTKSDKENTINATETIELDITNETKSANETKDDKIKEEEKTETIDEKPRSENEKPQSENEEDKKATEEEPQLELPPADDEATTTDTTTTTSTTTTTEETTTEKENEPEKEEL